MTRARVLLVPRWAGHPDGDFYPWLTEELAGEATLEALAMPTPATPTIERWVPLAREALGPPERRRETVLVGHSVGAMTAMRVLDDDGGPVAALLLVAGWWSVDAPWPTIVPWIETPFDVTRVRHNAPRARVLLSDADPFTRDYAANGARFERELGAEVTVVPGAKHFNAPQEPAVRDALRTLLASLP